MNGQAPSFYDENANRSFPFVENTLSDRISNACFLDFRGWSRIGQSPSPSFYMMYDSGSGHSIPAGYESFLKANSLHLFFDLLPGATLIARTVCVYIPDGNTTWPFLATASVVGQTKSFEARFILGSAISSVLQSGDNGVLNVGALILEPAQYLNVGGVVIDALNVIHTSGPNSPLSGDVVFQPGFNTSVSQQGNSIILNTRPGNGIGKNVYHGTDNGVCDGIVTSLNGAMPDSTGKLIIEGGAGIIIRDDPTNHQIFIGITPSNQASQCP